MVLVTFLAGPATIFSNGVSANESAVIARVPDKKSVSRVFADGRIEPLPVVGTGRGSGAIYAGEDFPAPSPDGRYVAYVRDRTLRLFDTASKRESQIFPHATGDSHQTSQEILITSWSVDGTKLLYYRSDSGPRTYWIYDISRDANTSISLPADFLVWVRDEEFILEVTAKTGRRSVVRWRRGDATARPFLLSAEDFSQFRRSRDGHSLVAVQGVSGRSNQVVRIDVASGVISPITPMGKWAEYQWPVFSPSGRKIAYFHMTGMSSGIISGGVVVDGRPVAKFTHYGKLEWVNERVLSIRDSCSFRVIDTENKVTLSSQPVLDGLSGASATQCSDGGSRPVSQKQLPGFDYQSYPLRDLDEIIAGAPTVQSIADDIEGRPILPGLKNAKSQAAMKIIQPQKMKLQVVLDAWSEPVANKTSLPQPPHEYALRAIGWNPPPPANSVVRVRSPKGRVIAMHIQDGLVPALKKEITPGERVTLYCLLFYYDKDGPGMIINEFSRN
jgi:WD40 repeat protein